MSLKVSKQAAEDILISFFYAAILFVFTTNQNLWIARSAIIIYCLWLIYKVIHRTIQTVDFLVLLPATLFVGTNYLIYLGIALIIIYGIKGIKKSSHILLDPEILGFSLMVLVGCVSSIVNAIDTDSAHLYMGVYILLELMVVGFGYFRSTVKCDASKSILIFSLAAFVFGLGYFMSHTITELFNTAHIEIYYFSNYGVYSNTLAGLMAPFLVGSAIIFLESKQRLARVLSGFGCFMMLLVILAIQSRGAYLGILLALLWLLSKKKVKKVFVIIIVAAIAILTLSLVVPDAILESLFGRFNISYFSSGDYSNGRLSGYLIALGMFKKYPIIGAGFWQFDAYNVSYSDPHNFVLAYLASTGIIGFLGFVIFIIGTFKRLKVAYYTSESKQEKILAEIGMCAFIIYLAHGLVEPSLTTSTPLSIFIIITNIAYKSNKSQYSHSVSQVSEKNHFEPSKTASFTRTKTNIS